MARPVDVPAWASNANHPAGTDDWSAQPTKVEPSSGKKAGGFVPQTEVPAEEVNWLLNNFAEWTVYLDESLFGLMSDIWFGDGSTGDFTTVGNSTLTDVKFYNDLTVDTGHTITAAGCPIFVNGVLTIRGTIANSGVAGASGASGGAGGAGAAGTIAGGGSAGGQDVPGVNLAHPAQGGLGGAGGLGLAGAGAAGGTKTGTASEMFRSFPALFLGNSIHYAGGWLQVKGGTGGGGGNDDGVANSGGGGGGGGGTLIICARSIVWEGSGAIRADGGAGGAGQLNAGGGGGGGGGLVVLLYGQSTGTQTVSAAGGAGGAIGSGTSAAGVAGSVGTIINRNIASIAGSPSPPHVEAKIQAVANTGAGGAGEDFVDVTFSSAYGTANDYSIDATIVLTSGSPPTSWWISAPTTTGFRINFSSPYTGFVRWRTELIP